MENSSAVQWQHHHEQSCISAVFSFIWYSFGMRRGPIEHKHEQDVHSRNLSELPKRCIKAILSFTTPRDVCRLAAVSRLFRSAANSDSVWSKFIPPQCYQILPRAVTFILSSSKREFYFRLCDSILIDEGTKRFWLERSTGKIGYMLSSRAIWICHGGDRRYWRCVSRDDSRFDRLMKLESVCWLEFGGAMDCRLLSSDTEYRVVFRLKFTEDSYGWTGYPASFKVITPEGEEINSEQLFGEREGANDGLREVIAREGANDGLRELIAREGVVFTLKFAEDSHGYTRKSVSFQVTTPEGEEEINLEQLFGESVSFEATTPEGEEEINLEQLFGESVSLEVTTPEGEEINLEQLFEERECANNGWIEVVAAEFTVRAAHDLQNDFSSMSFRMSMVTPWWKGGLLVDGVTIEPCKST